MCRILTARARARIKRGRRNDRRHSERQAVVKTKAAAKIMNGMGYKGRATPHGFRALASSILNEQGFNPDAIERQLAHVEEDRIRAAYNRADYMDERREMMQWYSDYLRERYEAARVGLAAESDGE